MNKQNKYNLMRIAGLTTLLGLAPICGAQQASTVDPIAAYEESLRINTNMPGGKFTVSTVDMRIKIANGYFTWSREYDGNGWRFSPHLAPLRFDGPRVPLGMGAGGGGSGGGGGSAAAPTPPAPVQESFGYVGAFVAYESDPNLVSVPLASIEQVIRNGAIFEADEKYRFYQQKGSTSGRYFVESTFIQDRGVFYRWQDRSGDWVLFDAKTGVDSYGDANGLTASMEYENGPAIDGRKGKRLKAVKDRNGNVVLTFVYDQVHPTALREVREVLLPGESFAPRVVKYDYDFSHEASGVQLLTKATDAGGNTTSFGYDDTFRLTSITDGEGHTRRVEYQGKSSRKVKEVEADGTVTAFEYSYDKMKKQYAVRATQTTVDDRRVEEEFYDIDGAQIRKEINGELVEEYIKDGGRESYQLNAMGFVVKTTTNEFDLVARIDYPNGSAYSAEYSPLNLRKTKEIDEGGMVTSYEYDEKGNLIKSVAAVDKQKQRITTYKRNAFGDAAEVRFHGRTEANGLMSLDSVWTFEFDQRGNVNKSVDPEGNVRRYTYNSDEILTSSVDPYGNTTITDVDGMGRPIRKTDALGNYSAYTYDAVGNLLTERNKRGLVTTRKFDSNNNEIEVNEPGNGPVFGTYQMGKLVLSQDSLGTISRMKYDLQGRLSSRVDGDGNAIEYSYALPENTEQIRKGMNQNATKAKFPTRSEEYEFDRLGNVVKSEARFVNDGAEAKRSVAREYDKSGALIRSIISGIRETKYSYDEIGQISKVVDANGKSVNYIHDVHGNLLEVKDQNNNIYKFEFNRLGQIVNEILPLGQSLRFDYDKAGNVSVISSAESQAKLIYDKVNRISNINYSSGADEPEQEVEYIWNSDDNLAMWSVRDARGNEVSSGKVEYSEFGKKIKSTTSFPGGYSLSVGYQYNAVGQKSAIIWPDGTSIAYSWRSTGVLDAIAIPDEGVIKYADFYENAPRTVLFPGGIKQTRGYNGLQNLEKVTVKTAGAQTLLALENRFNQEQNLGSTRLTYSIPSGDRINDSRFEYDSLDRLIGTSVNHGGVTSYADIFTLDNVGNRIAQSSFAGPWAYDANNRIVQRGQGESEVIYHYDARGNLIKKIEKGGATSYKYSAAGHLVEASGPDSQLIARYGYDPAGRRIWREVFRGRDFAKLEKAKRVLYLYADEGLIAEAEQEILLNIDGSTSYIGIPSITRQYGVVPDTLFGTNAVFMWSKQYDGTQKISYYHNDQRGAPLVATDRDGNITWAAEYDAFGKATVLRSEIVNDLRLPGQIEDSETGLHYNYRRYYDPSLGRYVQKDPIGVAGGLNEYLYAEGNPNTKTDPLGLAPWDSLPRRGICIWPFCPPPPLPGAGPLPQPTPYDFDDDDGSRSRRRESGDEARSRSAPKATGQNDDVRREEERKKDYKNYKDRCNQPTPKGGDKCQQARFKLGRQRACLWLRLEHNDRFYDGKDGQHNPNLYPELEKSIKEAQKAVDRHCKPGCK